MANLTLIVLYLLAIIFITKTSLVGTEGIISLFPKWSSSNNGGQGTETTTVRSGTNCAAILDVNKHGSPNCPRDHQYFDIQSCQFACHSSISTQRTAIVP